GPVLHDGPLVDQLLEVVDREGFYGGDLVGGTETVEEVQERNPGAEGGGVGDRGHVLSLLSGVRYQHRPAGLAGRHHVRVVTEDRQGVGGDGAGGDVDHCRGQFPGDLVHVGDHQEETLRGGEGGGESTRLQRAVDGTGGAALALHLDDLGNDAPDVGLALL